MNSSIAIQVLPQTNNKDQVIPIVDQVIDYIASTGLNYFVGPFETTIEGDYNQLMEILKEVNLIAVKAGAQSVACYTKIFFNPNKDGLTIEKKVGKYHK